MSEPLLRLQGATVRFGGLTALDAFSMDVRAGTIHALIGPNGAGKSTAFNVISRFYDLAGGDILFDSRPISRLSAHMIPLLGISRTFQNIELCRRMTALENVLVGMHSRIPPYLPFLPGKGRFAAEREAVRKAEELLDRAGLGEFRDEPADQLAFGHQKMLDLLRALATEPRLLLLDEPAAGLRNREIEAIDRLLLDLCRRQGLTIVLVEHVMKLVMSVADRITVLNFGNRIAEGTPAEVRGDPRVLEAYLGKSQYA